jgi:hypothetical protein
MIRFIAVFALFCSFLCSCELHKQEAHSQNNELSRKFASFTKVESLFKAITDDDYLQLKSMLDEDPSLALVVNKDGESLLVKAVEAKRLLSVYLLVSLGADIDYRGPSNLTAIDIINKNDVDIKMKPLWLEVLSGGDIPKPLLGKTLVSFISEAAEDEQEQIWSRLRVYFDFGADVNTKGERYTLLGLAASKPLPILTEKLCQVEGIDLRAVSGRFLRFIKEQARVKPKFKYQEVYDILIKYGAK